MHLVSLLSLNILSVSIFSWILHNVNSGGFLRYADTYINLNIPAARTDVLTDIITTLDTLADPTVLTVALIIFIGYAIYKRKYHIALSGLVSVPLVLYSTRFLKEVIHINRPGNALVSESNFSFPSLHATIISFLCTLLLYWLIHTDSVEKRKKYIIGAVSILTALAVGASRVYLGAHWMSDVLAGFMNGIFWATLVLIADIATGGASRVFEHHQQETEKSR